MLSFTFRYAAFWRRAVALAIDLVVLLFGAAILLQPFIDFLGLRQTAEAARREPLSVSVMHTYGVWAIATLTMAWLYFAYFESSRSQATIGKRIMGLFVCTKEETRMSFRRASYRFFAKLISAGTLSIGFLIACWDTKHRALHDRIVRTIVISERSMEELAREPSV